MDLYKEKIKFPFKCPVCGKEKFIDLENIIKEDDNDVDVYKIDTISGEKIKITDQIEIYCVHCSHCGWMYDLKQVLDYDTIGNRNNKTVNELKVEYQDKLNNNPNYNYDAEISKPVPHKCPICGEHEFKNINSYDVCPACGWIDDGTEDISLDDYSEVNVISIKNAKEEFKKKRLENPKYKWKNNQKINNN